jgi:hypothetical protein
MKCIEQNGRVCGFILESKFSIDEGIEFFTDQSSEFQMGLMNRRQGYIVKPHKHPSSKRVVEHTSEVLIVRSGSIMVKFYGEGKATFYSERLSPGDICMFLSGGHGVEFLEDSEVLEIKQGPHLGVHDKTFI